MKKFGNDKISNCSNIEKIEQLLDFNFFCQNLKYEDNIIVLLYYMERFTDKEIAQILNMKESTVKSKRTRAIQKIKNDMKGGTKIYG